ncbi:MAG: hypothetical protein U0136_13640 [Bdellovibrionota bacterium]
MNPFGFLAWLYVVATMSSRGWESLEVVERPRRQEASGPYVPRDQAAIEQDIAIVLAGKLGKDEASQRLVELQGRQAEAVLRRMFAHPEQLEFCDPTSDFLPSSTALARVISRDGALSYLPALFGENELQKRRAMLILQFVRNWDALDAVQAALVASLSEGALERREIALMALKAPTDRLFRTEQTWYERLAKHAEAIASVLDVDFGDETERFQHAIFDLIARLPSNRDVAGVRAKSLLNSTNEAFRAAAVWCRVTYLCLNDHAALSAELPDYLNDSEKVRSAACAAIADARMKLESSGEDLSELAVSLLRFVLHQSWGGMTEYRLVPVICKLPCELPTEEAAQLESASREGRIADHHFAKLLSKVKRDWRSVPFVSACDALLRLERERIPLLGNAIGCPWDVGLRILENADFPRLFATLNAMEPTPRTDPFVARLVEIAKNSEVSYYRVRLVSLGNRAWSLLASMSSVSQVLELVWKHLDDGVFGEELLMVIFSNRCTHCANLLRLISRAERSLASWDIQQAARYAESIHIHWLRRRSVFDRLARIYMRCRNDVSRCDDSVALVRSLHRLDQKRGRSVVTRYPFERKPPQRFEFH